MAINVMERLLPTTLITKSEKDEKCMQGVSYFVLNLLSDTIKQLEDRNPKALDAFPGDGNCQSRLVILLELFEKPTLFQELDVLRSLCTSKLQRLLERRKNHTSPTHEFFQTEIESLKFSEDLLFLMDCRMSNITRVHDHMDESGVIYLKTDPGKLSALFKNISKVEGKKGSFRHEIILNASYRLSSESMARLQQIGRNMHVSTLIQRMVDQVLVMQYEKCPSRIFGCQFFTVKVALCKLLENQTPVFIKTIVPRGQQSQYLFLKAQKDDFLVQNCDDTLHFKPRSYVAIFQGIVPSMNKLIAKINEIGFIELVLCYAAQQDPYQPGSTLQAVKDPEAHELLKKYHSKAQEAGCLKADPNTPLKLFHLYSDTLQEEFITQQFNRGCL